MPEIASPNSNTTRDGTKQRAPRVFSATGSRPSRLVSGAHSQREAPLDKRKAPPRRAGLRHPCGGADIMLWPNGDKTALDERYKENPQGRDRSPGAFLCSADRESGRIAIRRKR